MSQDIVEIASSVGVDREELGSMISAIRANHHLLETCRGPHNFVNGDMSVPFIHRIATCSICKGELRMIEADWYRKGLARSA